MAVRPREPLLALLLGGCALDPSALGTPPPPPPTTFCEPGTSEPCAYSGAAGTQNVGQCRAGARVCDEDGAAFGPCEGEILPAAAEDCGSSRDDDCNGVTNDGCVCEPDATYGCYEGPPASLGVGPCAAGKRLCSADGQSLGPCDDQIWPSLDNCVSGADEDCDGSVAACTGGPAWQNAVSGFEQEVVHAVTTDSGGNVYVTGSVGAWFVGSTYVEADVFVAKFAPDGSLTWFRTSPAPGVQFGKRIAVTSSDRIVVAGVFAGEVDLGGGPLAPQGGDDVFLLILDSDGNHQLSKSYGDPDQQSVEALAVAGDSIFLGGAFASTIDFGGGPLSSAGDADGYVAEVSSQDGAWIGASALGGLGKDGVTGIAVGTGDRLLVAGNFSGQMTVGGTLLVSQGLDDAFIVRFDPAGKAELARGYGGPDGMAVAAVASGADDAMLLAGTFDGQLDFFGGTTYTAEDTDAFVLALAPNGAHAWSKTVSGAGTQTAAGMVTDRFGNVLVTGSFLGETVFDAGPAAPDTWDAYVTKLAPDGTSVWARTFGPAGDQFALAVAADPSANIVAGGLFESSIELGRDPLTAVGQFDGWIGQLVP